MLCIDLFLTPEPLHFLCTSWSIPTQLSTGRLDLFPLQSFNYCRKSIPDHLQPSCPEPPFSFLQRKALASPGIYGDYYLGPHFEIPRLQRLLLIHHLVAKTKPYVRESMIFVGWMGRFMGDIMLSVIFSSKILAGLPRKWCRPAATQPQFPADLQMCPAWRPPSACRQYSTA